MNKNNFLTHKIGIALGLLVITRLAYLIYEGISRGYFLGKRGITYHQGSLGYYAALVAFPLGIFLILYLIRLSLKKMNINKN